MQCYLKDGTFQFTRQFQAYFENLNFFMLKIVCTILYAICSKDFWYTLHSI